jgi:hypothetical protein
MKKSRRRWFFVGSDYGNVALIDLEEGVLLGYIEPQIVEDESDEEVEAWKAKESIESYELVAVVQQDSKEFPYDPDNEQSYKDMLVQAVKWVELAVGPPTKRVGCIGLWLRSLMIWKYRQIRVDNKLVGLAPKKEQKQ